MLETFTNPMIYDVRRDWTDPCGSSVWVQGTHHHNNNNSFNKPTWNTYNINTLFTSSCSCLNTYVLCTLHALQLRTCTVSDSLWCSCGCKTWTFSTIYQWTVPRVLPEWVVRKPYPEQVVVSRGGKGKTGLTWNQNLEPSTCVQVWGSPRQKISSTFQNYHTYSVVTW